VTETCEGPVCITCSDQGEPATVLDTDGLEAQVRLEDGEERTVDVTLVDPLAPGDEVLLHAGVAITRLDPVASRGREAGR
jgi:hydrogenase maturation factor